MALSKTLNLIKVSALGVAISFAVPSVFDRATTSAGLDIQIAKAEAQAPKKKKTKRRKLPGLSESFFKQMAKAQEQLSPDLEENPDAQPDYPAALKTLKGMEKKCADKCNKYELSQIYNFYAFAYYSMDDVNKALIYFDKVVQQTPLIPLGVEKATLYKLAQISASVDKYDEALVYIEKWKKLSDEVTSDVHYLIATINFQKGDKDAALVAITKAIDLVEGRGKIAKENWYNIKSSVLIEKERYKDALPIIKKQIKNYSKDTYWIQLGGIFGLIGDEKNQLQAFDTTYLMDGLSKEQELLNLSFLYIGEGVPYRAAQIMQKGIDDKIIKASAKNLESLGLAYARSREPKNAIKVLQKAAEAAKAEPLKKGEKRKTGDIYALISGYYLDLDEPKNAVKAANKAISAGNLKQAGVVYTNLGIAHVELKNYSAAIKAFNSAMKSPKHKKFALNWKKYAQGELNREKALAASK